MEKILRHYVCALVEAWILLYVCVCFFVNVHSEWYSKNPNTWISFPPKKCCVSNMTSRFPFTGLEANRFECCNCFGTVQVHTVCEYNGFFVAFFAQCLLNFRPPLLQAAVNYNLLCTSPIQNKRTYEYHRHENSI
jgi:hypothetical protein